MDNFSAHAHGGCPDGHSKTDAIGSTVNVKEAPPPPDPVELGYFNGNGNSAEVAQGVCVLVASYQFKGGVTLEEKVTFEEGATSTLKFTLAEREGNDKDLANLKKTFEGNRKCKYYELDHPSRPSGPSESNLLAFLENQESKLTKAFNLQENDKPSVLILIILSHGHVDGKIFTETQGDELTTYKVMESLRKSEILKDSLKLVFFGACRGHLMENMASEFKVTRLNEYNEVIGATECERKNAYRVSSQPNEKNFIIVYSSVETTVSWRDGALGTRLVHALCYCLNNLPENTALPDFLTVVKSRIQSRTVGEGQSVQVVYFPHKPLTINKYEGGGCDDNKSLSYKEKSDSGHELLKRKAVIYCENGDSKAARDVDTFLEGLNFETVISTNLVTASETFKNSVEDESFEQVGFLFFCIFGKLVSMRGQDEHEQICVEGNPIQNVVSGFIGSTHDNLDRRPKIFFFVDRQMETDVPREKVEFKEGGTFFSGVMILILTGADAEKHLTEIFTKLSQAEGTLQNAVHHVFEDIYKNTAQEIHPRIISTVPCPVHFPKELYIFPQLRLTHFYRGNQEIQSSDVTHPYKSSDIDGLVRELFKSKTSGEVNREAKNSGGPQIFLVSAAAGMGKTHSSKKICKSFKKQFPSMGNVFEIQLSKAYIYLKKPNSSMLGLIKETNKVDCDLKTTRLLCLDGFDEMSATNRGELIKLIDATLKECPHITLWITTRPHEAPEIKKVLQPYNYLLVEILPLDKEAQKQMFSYHSKNDGKKGSYEIFKSLVGSRAEELLENPLLFNMVRELVEDEPHDGQRELNIFDIYDKIINKKLRDSLGRSDFSDELLNLIKAATSYLGKEPDYSFLDKSEVMILNKTGLISVDKDTKRANFEHRTFAEYLVTSQVIGLCPVTFPREFSYDDIFKDDSLSHCRYFLEQYFQRGEREILPNIKDKFNSFLNEHGKLTFVVKLCCQEGLLNIFKMIPQTGVEIFSNVNNFVAACGSNEDLALALIDNGFQVESLFDEQRYNVLQYTLRNIFIKNSKRLLEKMTRAFPSKKGKLFEFLKKSGRMDGLDPLHMAARYGDIDMLELIIASGADIKLKSTGWYQETVLLTAVRLSPDIEVVKFLIEQGADPFSERNVMGGQNCLHLAAEAGKLELVDFLMSRGASKKDINATDSKGRTALHLAAKKGHLEIIKALCEAEVADVKSRDSEGWTALHIAVENGNLEMIKYFVEKDPTLLVKITSNRRESVLHVAAKNRASLDVFRLIVQHREDRDGEENTVNNLICPVQMKIIANATDERGQTALHIAAKNGHTEAIEVLCDAGADVCKIEDGGNSRSSLHFAVESKNLESVKFLLEKDPSLLTKKTDGGKSALDVAVNNCYNADFEIIRYLIEQEPDVPERESQNTLRNVAKDGNLKFVNFLVANCPNLDINACDKCGRTALHLAAKNGHLEVVKALCEAGADVQATDQNEWTVLHHASCAAGFQALEVMRYLVGMNPSLIHCKTKEGQSALELAFLNVPEPDFKQGVVSYRSRRSFEVVEFLIEQGADPSDLDSRGLNCLHWAADRGQIEMVNFLISRKPKMDIDASDKEGQAALHFAVEKGHLEIIKALCEAGADVKTMDKQQWTALLRAASRGHLEIVKFLVAKDKSLLNLKSKYGRSALHLAAAQKDELNTVNFLISQGLLASDTDGFGQNCLHLAAKNGPLKAVKVFLALEPKIDINAFDMWGKTALHYAAKRGSLEILKALCKAGADSKKATLNADELTALHLAAQNNLPAAVAAPIIVHIVECNENFKWTALHFASNNGNVEMVEYLFENYPLLLKDKTDDGKSALHLAAGSTLCNGVYAQSVGMYLAQKGLDPSEVDGEGRNSLHYAAQVGYFYLANFFIDHHEPKVDVNASDDEGKTALIYAAIRRNDLADPGIHLVETLCKAGADVKKRDHKQWTALHHACHEGNLKTVEFLVKKEPSLLKVKTDDGRSALHLAAGCSEDDEGKILVEYLIKQQGFDPSENDSRGRNALHCARESGNLETVNFLLAHDGPQLT